MLKFIKHMLVKFLDWVVTDVKQTGVSISSGGMVVTGFMRDYVLLSKIDKKHFANGAKDSIQNSVYTSNIRNNPSSFNARLFEDDEAESVEVLDNSEAEGINLEYLNTNGKPTKKMLAPDANGIAHLPSPKQVFLELQTYPTPVDLVNLDAKIATYLRIHGVIRVDSSRGNRETILDVIQRLKNRKKYVEDVTYKTFFDQFKNTTDDAINILLDAHSHLKIGPADDFIPEMPVDAHEKLLAYSDMVVKMCGDKPVFYLIAKETDFHKVGEARKERDPILLVQSPIGMFWQIIGAWGVEDMLLVNDL